MKTLLIHALNPEAALIRARYPAISERVSHPGMALHELSPHYDILRTGIGLERTAASLKHVPSPDSYQLFLQFGVSGSLAEELPVHSKICAHTFTALDREPLKSEKPQHCDLPHVQVVRYFSSMDVVSDEASRQIAISHGAQAVDMESYEVAYFCAARNIPFTSLRIISDRAGASTPEEFRNNFKRASELLQNYLIEQIL
ncbi:MAG: hypothetical protein K9M49_00615 [Candidatus Marinimicrobia bacterium]|nr:hypothetical protein [Candidatus Neomarinimicrobiota bacterium]MCF7850636.1 hypothetical protein [Candidatus Neomarinimicrobiota bacterium]MCF7903630.1 hypothetical protein [Candidatus Neomarinimicrobiota bacterium]